MAMILFSALALCEAGLLITGWKDLTKKEWSSKRLVTSGIQAALFLLMLFLPGIDTSFRFKLLMFMLGARLAVALAGAVIRRKNGDPVKRSSKIMSMILSIVLIFVSLFPAFIFKDYSGRPVTGPYEVRKCSAILIDSSRVEQFEDDGSFREVPVYFFYPEGAAKKMPLVIFSHGAFGYYQSNVSTYMELASNGYVVVSLDHPYHSFFTTDTNGKTITVDPEFISTVMSAGNETEETIYEISRDWMKLRTDDMNFTIDTIIKGANEGDLSDYFFAGEDARSEVASVLSLIDTDHIGLMGHSLGGATSVEVGRQRDDIDAVIDIDGTMLGHIEGAEGGRYIIDDSRYVVPLLEFENENAHEDAQEARRVDYPYPNNTVADNADTCFRTYFTGSLHMDYTDLPLFSPFLAGMLGSGDVDHGYMIDQVNRLALEFFDCYLKGEGQFSVSGSYQGAG